jgi:hypothetical protein
MNIEEYEALTKRINDVQNATLAAETRLDELEQVMSAVEIKLFDSYGYFTVYTRSIELFGFNDNRYGFIRAFPKLEILVLTGCDYCKCLKTCSRSVKVLRLNRCKRFGNMSFIQNFPNLESLFIDNMTINDEFIEILRNAPPNLKTIVMYKCQNTNGVAAHCHDWNIRCEIIACKDVDVPREESCFLKFTNWFMPSSQFTYTRIKDD